MYKKVYLRDLECYKSASDEMKQHPLFGFLKMERILHKNAKR